MKKVICAVSVICFISLSVGYGQQYIKVDKDEFRISKEGFKDAWKSIHDGDKYFKSGVGMYPEAVVSYLIADEYNSDNAELNYKIAVSYLFGEEPLRSLGYLLEAYELKPDVSDDILFLIGKAYQLDGDYGKAIDYYNMYSDKYHESEFFIHKVNELINQCNLAIEMSDEYKRLEIKSAGMNINSSSDDYSPVLSYDGEKLYFTSRRNIEEEVREREDADMKWDENIFVSDHELAGWGPARPAGENLCTASNEGVISIAANGLILYIYAGYEGNGDILISENQNGIWSVPEKPGFKLNKNSRETSISITADENEIFFTSDNSKGFGGRDIYLIKRVRRNKWTKPQNLGDTINSDMHEESVHVSSTGDTIWFSSNRPGGIGGFDVYMSVRNSTGNWSVPVNMGMPVNSQSNDLFYRPSPSDSNEAWLASDRPGGYGGFDIYSLIRKPLGYIQPDTSSLDSQIIRDTTTFVPQPDVPVKLPDR